MPKSGKVVVRRSTWSPATPSPASRASRAASSKGGPIYACKVQKVCPKCNKPTRIGHKVEGDKKVRICKKCGAEI